MTRSTWTIAGLLSLGFASPVSAQSAASERDIQLLRLMGTPIGALSPIALPMPASRNHNYFIGRFQTGQRRSSGGTNLAAAAVGVDLQYRGGSIYGLTAGYQERECRFAQGQSCGGHALFGARAQVNLITGGSTMARMLRDNSTTSTFGTEIGFGYAPNVTDGMNACTIDFGLPFSVAKRRQRPRFVTYITPGMVWDMSCRSGGPPTKKSYFTGFGIGLQQVGNRSLDVYLGMQKVFRPGVGNQLGISVTYVRLP